MVLVKDTWSLSLFEQALGINQQSIKHAHMAGVNDRDSWLTSFSMIGLGYRDEGE